MTRIGKTLLFLLKFMQYTAKKSILQLTGKNYCYFFVSALFFPAIYDTL